MERFEASPIEPESGAKFGESFRKFEDEPSQEKIVFTPEQQQEIETKRRILSSLAYFIGKDFRIPVELNEPGKGWHWDFQENIIRIDPKDLLEKPMDYLRFVISHEGGHRRISRTEFIPVETWRKPSFSFMMNAIEDPRDNNFVAENYPKFREQMQLAYEMNLDLENKFRDKAQEKLGHQPRFMQAGFEYIKQWFLDQEDAYQISEDLPDEVKQVVRDTIQSARDSWTTYPSRSGADGKESEVTADGRTVTGEDLISEYARASYQINLERVWPEFQKLVEKDREDQRTQELLDEMQQGQSESGGQGLPQELSDQLTPEEQEELEKVIDDAIEKAKQEREQEKQKDQNGETGGEKGSEPEEATNEGAGEPGEQTDQKGRPIDLDSLSPELRQKIKDYIDSLPEDKKKELAEKAEKSISDFEKELDEELGGKLSEDPEKKEEREEREDGEHQEHRGAGGTQQIEGKAPGVPLEVNKALLTYKERANRELLKDVNIYEEVRREVLPIIDKLEAELRAIFVERQARKWESGFRTGKRIDIKRRIQEKAKSVPVMESDAWQRKELPQERDYAILLLVDLSGSMWFRKRADETFKAVVVLAEVLNRLGINLEISGFNDEIFEYQGFDEEMANTIRERMGGMLQETEDSVCKNCGREHRVTDIGWATEVSAERLEKQKSDNKFLVTLSDGEIDDESDKHPKSEFDLGRVIKTIMEKTDIKLVGLGVGKHTEQMTSLYPNSVSVDTVEEMAEKLADLIREAIANYDKF